MDFSIEMNHGQFLDQKNDKKRETLSFQGFSTILILFFFFRHECIEDLFDHIPFSICFDLF